MIIVVTNGVMQSIEGRIKEFMLPANAGILKTCDATTL
jgi:hypothetical protein